MKKFVYFLAGFALSVSVASMAGWNGSGSFSREHSWADDRDAGIPITASRMDAEDDNFASGINNALAKDGQNAMTGNLDLDGNAIELDADGDSRIGATADDRIDFTLGGSVSSRFGHDSTNSSAIFLFDGPTTTAQANTNIGRLTVKSSSALTIPTGTTAIAAGLWVDEPNLTATGTITAAATAYISGAPTEGSSNYALWVDDGAAQLDGTLKVEGVTTVGGNIVSDTDSTDDLGTTSVRWANVYTDSIGDTGQALTVAPSSVTWSNDPTHSGNHTYSGNLTVSGAFTSPGIDDNADTTAITINSSENVLIGTTTAATGNPRVDIVGHLTGASSASDATSKDFVMASRHYTIAEEPALMIYNRTISGNNLLKLGGGHNGYNTATQIQLYAASDSTTMTGTEVGRLDASKNVLLNDTLIGDTPGSGTPSARLHVKDSAAGNLVVIESTDDSSSGGPILVLERSSSSPAANDTLSGISFVGDSSTGSNRFYARDLVSILDPTDGSEDGERQFFTSVAGTSAVRLSIAAGLYTPSATGGDQGADTINASAFYDDGVQITPVGDDPEFTTIELGHASDTTLARAAAGTLSVEGVTVPTISSTNTLTNKTISGSSNTLTVLAASQLSGAVPVANGGTASASGDPIARFWINFNGSGTIATRDSFNVTSITDEGTGSYTVTIATDFSNANYSAYATSDQMSTRFASSATYLAGSIRVSTADADGAQNDAVIVTVGGFGDQ